MVGNLRVGACAQDQSAPLAIVLGSSCLLTGNITEDMLKPVASLAGYILCGGTLLGIALL